MKRKLTRSQRIRRVHRQLQRELKRQLKKLLGKTKPLSPLPAHRREQVRHQSDVW